MAEALKQGRISHAYLFTGPRGVGKTSIARILAHEINGLPYEDDTSHIDIIEIDAASNRRIDEIRELREKVHVAPASAKYKVYIIDEVHMLTREAFNALLKTLEEPPAHAVFILATTDAHKLPKTIISRTQRFSFKPVPKDEVATHLGEMAKQEKIKITPEALALLAEHGEGSFRDSISLLDQASSHGKKVDIDDVRGLLGLPPAESIQQLLALLAGEGASIDIVRKLTELTDHGYQPAAIARQLGQMVRQQLIENRPILPADTALALLERLLEVPSARDPERLLEIVLLENMPERRNETSEVMPAEIVDNPEQVDTVTKESAAPEEMSAEKPEPSARKIADNDEKATSEQPKPKKAKNVKTEPLDSAIWPEVLSALKRKHNTLYGIVRMAEPKFQVDGSVELAFAFAFHQKRLNEAGNRQKLVDTIHSLTNRQVRIECVLDATASPPKAEIKTEAPEELAAISSIFGGGELLES